MSRPEIWLFGNPDLAYDSLPVRLQPLLTQEFPQADFIVLDPLDEWPERDNLIIIDTIRGLEAVRAFTSLKDFSATSLVTMHDFDLKNELEFRLKLGLLPPFVIIGLPPPASAESALRQLKPILSEYAK